MSKSDNSKALAAAMLLGGGGAGAGAGAGGVKPPAKKNNTALYVGIAVVAAAAVGVVIYLVTRKKPEASPPVKEEDKMTMNAWSCVDGQCKQGQLGQFASKEECEMSGACTDTRWTCVDKATGKCAQSASGKYESNASCQRECVVPSENRSKCVCDTTGGLCIDSINGTMSCDECEKLGRCKVEPETRYGCVVGQAQCQAFPAGGGGTYRDPIECAAQCDNCNKDGCEIDENTKLCKRNASNKCICKSGVDGDLCNKCQDGRGPLFPNCGKYKDDANRQCWTNTVAGTKSCEDCGSHGCKNHHYSGTWEWTSGVSRKRCMCKANGAMWCDKKPDGSEDSTNKFGCAVV